MIKLYGFFRSRSNRAMWALEEIGAPYEFYQLDFKRGDPRSDFYRAINPACKMPALQDDDLCLSESCAICNYLGEKFPESGLTPPSATRERAVYDQWMFFVLSELEQPLWTKGKHTFAIPEEYRVPAVLDTALWEFARAAKLLSKGLGDNEYIAGDRFTMADILVAQTLRWAVNFKYPIEHDNLTAYLEHMEARPAYARMAEKPHLEIPQSA